METLAVREKRADVKTTSKYNKKVPNEHKCPKTKKRHKID